MVTRLILSFCEIMIEIPVTGNFTALKDLIGVRRVANVIRSQDGTEYVCLDMDLIGGLENGGVLLIPMTLSFTKSPDPSLPPIG